MPPTLYGGIERIVDMLVRGLVERGHDLTLFANPDSRVPCRLLPYPALHSQRKADTLKNMWHVSSYVHRGRIDVVHSFARLAYLAPLLPSRTPKIMSYQRVVTPRSVTIGNLFSRGTLHFTGCSAHVLRQWALSDHFHVIYNGVPLNAYRATEYLNGDAPLAYLGRVEEIKGVHLAIEVARQSGRRLVIAGNVPEAAHHRGYFEQKILPQVDGSAVQDVGAVDDRGKNGAVRAICRLADAVALGRAIRHCHGRGFGVRNPGGGFAQGIHPKLSSMASMDLFATLLRR